MTLRSQKIVQIFYLPVTISNSIPIYWDHCDDRTFASEFLYCSLAPRDVTYEADAQRIVRSDSAVYVCIKPTARPNYMYLSAHECVHEAFHRASPASETQTFTASAHSPFLSPLTLINLVTSTPPSCHCTPST